MEFTKLERAAIETILAKPMEGIDVLRMQFDASSVIKREYTGVGFYTTVSVPRSLPPVTVNAELQDHLIGGASGLVKDPRVVISFHLWVVEGYLKCLEGVTVAGGGWPDESKIQVFASYYAKSLTGRVKTGQ
jgi:hypothetical protein